MAGVTPYRAEIAGITQGKPCVVTTAAAHGYQTGQIVRFTDLGRSMPTARGMGQLDGNKYKIVVIDTTSFSLWDLITDEPIDSTDFDPWVSSGRVNLTTRVLALNHPETFPYSEENQYVSTAFFYEGD